VQKPEKATPEKNVRTYSYRNVTLPEFFEELTENHSGDFYLKDSFGYFGSNCASDFGGIVPVIPVQTVPFLCRHLVGFA
jgi:hypothetical protein